MRSLFRALPTAGVAVLLIAGAAPAVAVPVQPSTAAAVVLADSTPGPGDGNDSMPGMDMPAKDMPAGDATSPGEPAGNMPGMDMPADKMAPATHAHAGPVSRPRGAVLSTFAGLNAAALIGAAVLRRKTKDTHHPKRSTRVTTPTTA